MTREEAQAKLNQRFATISANTDSIHSNMIAQARDAYAKRWGKSLSAEKESILKSSLMQYQNVLQQRGMTRQQIQSAVTDISKVDNPISMLYNLMSILIPNFAYTEVVGVQPMPTKEAPIFFPQITANTARNGFAVGDKLLGSTNWATSNNYTTNKKTAAATVTTGSANVTFTASEGSVLPNTVVILITISGTGSVYIYDDGNGALSIADGYTTTTAGTVDYTTGAIAFTLAANATANDTVDVTYRYDWGSTQEPAQAIFEWASKNMVANPYRLRSTYALDNFYSAKQVLKGYDIDAVMATAIGGYINKEISGNVFDDMLARTDATYTWTSTLPTGVSWAQHRLSIVSPIVEGGNAIRQNVARSGGNYVVAGTDWMNVIETLGNDVWEPVKYSAEPIGPYVAGTLLGKFKVLKNQDYAGTKAVMGYKRDETDASYMAGVFIGLYSTAPLAKDDLNVVQGMGTQMASKKVIDNSLVELVYA